MARNITCKLDTGCSLNGDGDTALWAARASTSSAPSGIAEASTFPTQGVAWAFFDVVTATAAVEITVWSYRSAVGTWTILDSFGVSGVQSMPVGAHGLSVAVLGCDYVHVQVTDVTGGGAITVDATLSQEVR